MRLFVLKNCYGIEVLELGVLPYKTENYRSYPTTDRELDILRLLFNGLTNREMGEKLHLSPLTIRNYISQLLIKYGARNRTDLLGKFVLVRRHYHKRILP